MSSSVSLVSNEVTVKAKTPKRTSKPTTPPIVEESFIVAKTNYSPSVEGFAAPVQRSFPVYVGPSIYFKRSMMDIFYDKYDNENLKPNPEMLSLVNNMQVAPPNLPNFGAMLSDFDAGSITSIPWDADNATYVQSDVVWGQVTADASKSIFMKSYHAALLSDPSNIDTSGDAPLHTSAMFPVSANSPGAALFLQLSDAVGMVAGQMAVTYASEKIYKRFLGLHGAEALAKLRKARDARAALIVNADYTKSLYARVSDFTNKLRGIPDDPVLKSLDEQIAAMDDAQGAFKRGMDKAIAAKEEAKLALTQLEETAKAAQALRDANKGLGVAADGTKSVTKVGVATRLRMGARQAAKLAADMAEMMGFLFRRILAEFTVKYTAARAGIYAALSGMTAAFGLATAASGGAMAFMLAIVGQMLAAYTVLDNVCMVLTIVLMVLLPALLDKALANGGVCTDGAKPIDQIITDEFLYFLFSTFCPIGGLMDVFGPYICYSPDGTPKMKQPFLIPYYFADASLSISQHQWSPAQTPRPDSTSYADGVPPGWPIVAGIAREPCVAGTWTSSDVDMLCNISTYVPRTYPKQSNVPPTVVKGSKVPKTEAKDSFPATRIKDSVRQVTTPSYKPCPSGMRDSALIAGTIGDCWDDLKCKTQCSGDWNPTNWRCNTSCTGTGGIANGWHFYNRQTCPAGYDLYLSLCRSTCPSEAPATLATDLFCTGKCKEEETTWLAFCTGNTDGWCARNAGNHQKTGTNWKNVAGVCWKGCGDRQTDVGALCRDKCGDDQNEVAGVCWDKCAPNTIDIGALCRSTCSGSTPNDVAGVCWGSCGNDIDVGALCRERCRDGFHEVLGVCWGNIGTYARRSMIPKSIKTYDPGYNPPSTTDGLDFPWCDFAKDVMLDRMAQFYYDQSTLNPVELPDGRISYEYIVQFYGVTASSELSCDVACQMKTVKFDPVTGDRYEETLGTYYPDDPGNEVSYRRFYFINIDPASAALLAANVASNPSLYNKAWPADPQGLFTVTGCTNADETAPNAIGYSTQNGVDPIVSVPKIFEVRDKNRNQVQFSKESFATSLATTAATQLIGMVPPLKGSKTTGVKRDPDATQPSMAQQIGGAVAGGIAAQGITTVMNKALNMQQPIGAAINKAVIGPVSGSVAEGNAIFAISTNNDNFSINHGPIYEVRARDNNGYFPNITFCGKVNTTELLCSHPLVLRDTINLYHAQNPSMHIKTVNAIEPRGKDGCYYKINTTSYDANTNTEGNITTVREVVLKYEQNDKSTCVFTPTETFITDMKQYPIRSYYDINTLSTVYPTRNVSSSATVEGRYVRIRPSQRGDGNIRLSQIAVYDMTGTNLALSRPVYTNAVAAAGSGPPNAIVDGTLACRSTGPGVWIGGNTIQSTYIDIDLGKNFYISNVMVYGQLDVVLPDNDIGTRIEILYTNEANAVSQKQLLTLTNSRVEMVDFSTKMILPKLPVKPFEVPRPLPPETNLGSGCSTRCEDKNQIEAMIKVYNTTNTSSQIMKVIKAFTPKPDRCDYEADVVTMEGTTKSIGKQLISFAVGSQTTNTSSIIYGQYVRVNAIPYVEKQPLPNPLRISQIVVTNKAGNNVALGKKTFATINDLKSMNPGAYGISSLVTDGRASLRAAPDHWSSGIYSDMSIMVDMGISQDIASITIYGVEGTTYAGVVVQVLTSANVDAVPVYTKTLPAGQTSFVLKDFPACNFSYTQIRPAFSYIQDTTPTLDSVDTSGGVLSFKGISDSIVGIFNSIVNPIKTANPLAVLNKSVDAAEKAVSSIVVAAAANVQIAGCPNTKCTDPAILTSIANMYNTTNGGVTSAYGAETNTMTQITKAGVSGPNTCDVMFTNIYRLYDDFLYPPTISQNTTMVKRFTMTNTGNCALQATPGAAVIDLSSNAIGILPPSSALSSPFTVRPCQVNCRDPALIASLKTRLNSTTSTGTVTNFTTIMQSFANGGSTCEYYMTKDVSKQNSTTKKIKTTRGLNTYVTAGVKMNSANCSFTLDSVSEIDPELITTRQDPVTGLTTASINGAPVKLPFLFNYDNTDPSTRVNETPLNL